MRRGGRRLNPGLERFAVGAVRLALAGLFLSSGLLKLKGPQHFALAVKAFRILPDEIIVFVAFAIPWTEFLCAVFLLVGLWSRAAALVLAVLLVIFTAAIVSVLARHMSVACGCFGQYSGAPLGPGAILRNGAVLVGALLILWRGSGALSIDTRLARQGLSP